MPDRTQRKGEAVMKTKILVLLALLVIASLTLASVAYGDDMDDPEGPHALRARGDGLAALRGSGWVRVRGNGVLWVKGEEAIVIDGVGHVKTFPDGWTEYVGFRGLARIRGRDMSVMLAGERIDLLAAGAGRAFLWGKGSYRVGELDAQEWPEPFDLVVY
jgi:hypothetical protein